MQIINTKFNSICFETGAKIKKGEQMLYDYIGKKCYCMKSMKAIEFQGLNDEDPAASTIRANEEAYFDNFCLSNNI